MPASTLVHALRERATASPGEAALWRKPGDATCRAITWRELESTASAFGRGLLALGCPPGPLAWLCGHRPEWPAVEMGALGAGWPVAALFDRWPDAVVEDVLRRLGACAVVVEGEAQLGRIRALRAALPALQWAIALDPPIDPALGVRSFMDVLALGEREPESSWLAQLASMSPGTVAAILVTPGTCGRPKLLCHSHAALVAHSRRLAKALGAGPEDTVLARLPPALALERAVVHLAIVCGAPIHVAPREGSFAVHLREARPTLVHGTPDDWEALRCTVEERLAGESVPRQKVVAWARKAALEAHRRDDEGLAVPGTARAQQKLAGALVLQPLKEGLGLAGARRRVAGLAPMRRSTLELFTSLDMPLDEAWGMAETGGPAALNSPSARRLGAQGRALSGVAVRVAADGEIWLKGDILALSGGIEGQGASIDRHGWLRTGDLGALDVDGFLTLHGRKDELLAVGRRKIPAATVERRLCASPLVTRAIAFSGRKRPVALLELNGARCVCFARNHGLGEDPTEIAAHPTLLARLHRDLEEAQRDAPETDRVEHVAVVPRGFSLADGEVTPAGTLCRSTVARLRGDLLDGLQQAEARLSRPRVDRPRCDG